MEGRVDTRRDYRKDGPIQRRNEKKEVKGARSKGMERKERKENQWMEGGEG